MLAGAQFTRSRPRACVGWVATTLAVLLGSLPAGDALAVVATFREGTAAYAGTQDTEIQAANGNSSFGAATSIIVDVGGGLGDQQGLIRFDNIFGSGAGQIPLGATINSATLTVNVIQDAGDASAQITLHRMLATWSEASTWNSLVGGVQFDNVEASSTVDATIADPTATGNQVWSGANLTATVQAWSDGATNYGWAIRSDNTGDWEFRSSENGTSGSRPLLTVTYSFHISGTVFEDVNYGGGAGRSLAASSGVVRSGARVELFDAGGAFVTSTTTGVSGAYQFSGLDPAAYTVRAVNSGVTSSRTGYVAGLLPVQTFRTDASSGAAAAVTDHVGGEVPSKADAGNGSTTLAALTTATTTAQSITSVTVGTSSVTGVDFGYCYDLIVNTSDAGQGSVRQFLTNVNALSNTGLAQSGRTAGIDNAIWMLADGTARPGLNAGYASQFTSGVAGIAPTSALPTVTEAVVLDATTQPGWSSTPIVELNGTGAGAGVSGLAVTAAGSSFRGLAINRFPGSGVSLSGAGATGNLIAGNVIGADPTGTINRGNGAEGVRLSGGAASNTIGGTAAGAGNTIVFNTRNGVLLAAGALEGSAIEGNTIHSNTLLGIDLGDNGATANDGVKSGGQPNQLMDHPVFTSAILAGSALTVTGYVGSSAGQAAFAGSRIEVFESDNDASGFGEGPSYLGFVTSGATGNFSGTLTVSGVVSGDRVSGTATDGSGNTSEFGANATVELLGIVKRAFLADGTPVSHTTVVPKGTLVEFLLYLNNAGAAVNDVSLQDVLAAGFAYVPGSMRFSNTVASCAGPTCTGVEEAAILSAANSGTAGTDAVDGDVVSRSGVTLRAGNQGAANAQLDLAAAKAWAVVFSVRAQ